MCGTVLDELATQAQEHPDRPLYIWHDGDGTVTRQYTYAEFSRATDTMAHRMLTTWGAHCRAPSAGRHFAVLVYPPGLEFMVAFVACLKANVVAVPVYPPDPRKLAADARKVLAIAKDCGASVLLTTASFRRTLRLAALVPRGGALLARAFGGGGGGGGGGAVDAWSELATWAWCETDGAWLTHGAGGGGGSGGEAQTQTHLPLLEDLQEPLVATSGPLATLAFLQYTSGSTGAPKGVMVGHDQLLHNAMMPEFASRMAGRTFVSWLPQYHDLGLCAVNLTSMCVGSTVAQFSPLDFIKRPLLWLDLIQRYKAQCTAGPHFSYKLVAKRLAALPAPPKYDLSSIELAADCAEPVLPASLEQIMSTLEGCGLRRGAYWAGYGLAEHVVKTTCFGSGAVVNGRVSCGRPCGGTDIRIVDADSLQEVPEGGEGEVWLNSPSKGRGYYGKPEASLETFSARLSAWQEGDPTFLRTGDLGFMRDGELYISGRIKNLIIIGGTNYHPHDIEASVRATSADIRPGGVLAFGMGELEDAVVVLAELRPEARPDAAALLQDIASAVRVEHGIGVRAVALLRAGEVPKTTSGKLAHAAARAMWGEGAFKPVAQACFDGLGGGGGAAAPSCELDEPETAQPIAWADTREERQQQVLDRLMEQLCGPAKAAAAADPAHPPPDESSSLSVFNLCSMEVVQLQGGIQLALGLEDLDMSLLFGDASLKELAHQLEALRFPADAPSPTAAAGGTSGGDDGDGAAAMAAAAGGKARHRPRPFSRRQYASTLPDYTRSEAPLPAPAVALLQAAGLLLLPFHIFTVLYPVAMLVRAAVRAGGVSLAFALAPLYWVVMLGAALTLLTALRLALFWRRPLRVGRYPLYGATYLRWWLLETHLKVLAMLLDRASAPPVRTLALRAMGATVGPGATLYGAASASSALLTVGAGAELNGRVCCHMFLDRSMVLAPVTIGTGARVEALATVEPGANVEAGGVLDLYSVLPMGATVPERATSRGSPATVVDGAAASGAQSAQQEKAEQLEQQQQLAAVSPWLEWAWELLLCCVVHPYAVAVPLGTWLCVSAAIARVALDQPAMLLPALTIAFYVAGAAALPLVVVTKWLLVGRLRPGIMRRAPMRAQDAYETVVDAVLRPWLTVLPPFVLRLLLAAVGARLQGTCDAVTAGDGYASLLKAADLVDAGNGVFLGGGSGVRFKSRDPATGLRELHEVRLGEGAYLGNRSVLAHGCSMAPGAALAASSCALPGSHIAKGRVWAGVVAKDAFSAGPAAPAQRSRSVADWVMGELVVPVASAQSHIVLLALTGIVYRLLRSEWSWPSEARVWIPLYAASAAAAATASWALMVALTCTVLQAPLGTAGAPVRHLTEGSVAYHRWRLGFEYTINLQYALLPFLAGTPLLPLTYRLMGAQVGEGVFMGGDIWIYEAPYVSIGDGCTFNSDVTVSPHSRMVNSTVSLGPISIGECATLCCDAAVSGGIAVPERVLFGSRARPLQGQVLHPVEQYDNTPAARFVIVNGRRVSYSEV